jgi:hypothetical protein
LEIGIKDFVNRAGKKIRIFKIRQNAEVQNHRKTYKHFTGQWFFTPENKIANIKIRKSCENQQQKEDAASLPVEKYTHNKKKEIAETPVRIYYRINCKHHCKKHPKVQLGKQKGFLRRIK